MGMGMERSDLVSTASELRAGVRHSPWRRIISLVDFEDEAAAVLSPASHSALRYATTLAVMHRARVTALHVIPLPAVVQSMDVVDHERVLAQVAARLRQTVPREGFRSLIDVHVAMGSPYEEVLRVATEMGADLIALGRGDHTRMDSLARLRDVWRHAPCPVLIVHPAGQAAVA
jgi:nucleotide-binding universal stress UspA family protein